MGKNVISYHGRADELFKRGYSRKETFEICEKEYKEVTGKNRYTSVDSFRYANWRNRKNVFT